MRFKEIESLLPGQFKRLTGIKRETFLKMLCVLRKSEGQKKRTGRPSKLSLADQEYLHLHEARQERTKIIKDSRNAGQ